MKLPLVKEINKNSVLYKSPNGVILEAHPTFLQISDHLRDDVVNGCGPASWRFDIVPDKPFGFDFTWPCHGHDWDYFLYGVVADVGIAGKKYADKRAGTNWGEAIRHTPRPWYIPKFYEKRWRRRSYDVPKVYYTAVRYGGNSAYFGDEKTNILVEKHHDEIISLGLDKITL